MQTSAMAVKKHIFWTIVKKNDAAMPCKGVKSKKRYQVSANL